MRKIVIILLVVTTSQFADAQQLPLFSQYYFNSFIYNPSHTGIDEESTIGLIGRKQYTGLANSIGTYAATFQSRGTGKRSGFGVYLYNDNVNLFRTNAVSGNYAYHIPLSDGKQLSFGLALSALDHRYNASNFHLINEEDPVVALLGSNGGISVDGNAGVNMNFGKFSMGLANLQMLQNQEAFKDNSDAKALYTLANHWMFNAGYKIDINENFDLEPFLLYRKTKAAPGQVDINLFLNWLERGYAGIAYRDGMSFSTMIGAHLNNFITAGYSFDLTTNKLRSSLGNTHEVALRFNISKNKTTVGGNGDVLASKQTIKYKEQITTLEEEVQMLKKRKSINRIDTVTIEKIVVKEVVKEIPVEKVVLKEVPTRAYIPDPIVYDTKPTEPIRHVPTYTESEYNDPVATYTEVNSKFYVIAGSFASDVAASRYISRLANQGHSAYQFYDPANGRHYVHIGKFSDKSAAVDLIQRKKGSGLPLWVKTLK